MTRPLPMLIVSLVMFWIYMNVSSLVFWIILGFLFSALFALIMIMKSRGMYSGPSVLLDDTKEKVSRVINHDDDDDLED